MDLLTYFLGAVVVAVLAGLTGRMPMRLMRGAHPGSIDDADERSLPPELANAVAAAERLDPGRAVVASEMVDSLMQGTQFVALTGACGVGKTAVAGTIRDELSRRSVRVRWVDGGGGRGIRLRTIMSRFLDKPEVDVDTADVERMFDAMTEREHPDERLVLIIDDAEQLLPDAFGYLRLLASVAIERMPQVVFVGDPSFWDIADQAAQAGFTELIGARFELGALRTEEAGVGAPLLTVSRGRLPDAGTPGHDMAEAAHQANALVPMVLPSGRNRRIGRMAGLAAVAAGSLGAAAYWLGPLDLDRFRAAGPSGWQSSDAAPNQPPAATTVTASPAATPAPLAQLDGPAPGAAVRPQPVPPLAAPAGLWPAPQASAPHAVVNRRAGFSGYVARSTPGTWLFPPGGGRGGG